MKISQKIVGAGVIAAALVMGSVAGPAQAGVGGCSSLGKDGRFIVGSCTANNPGPNATMDLAFQCYGDVKGAVHYATVTVGYGSSFRYDSQCWIGLQDVWRDD
ncbi:hypothetical protein MMX123_02737 [Microbacterium sp. MM2322]|uniref:hypothetical protein n=1 Tax=Microbacterium sp. MM2322 TaxID=3157631 RepID=UPI003D8099EE